MGSRTGVTGIAGQMGSALQHFGVGSGDKTFYLKVIQVEFYFFSHYFLHFKTDSISLSSSANSLDATRDGNPMAPLGTMDKGGEPTKASTSERDKASAGKYCSG